MKKVNKQLDVKFCNLESSVQYPGMERCKIYVGYPDDNRNMSNIKTEVWNKANDESLKNIPIVGIYNHEEGKFKGHMDIDFDDNGLVITNPVPYGVIPESATQYWEEVTEEDGTIRNYNVVDGALLWTKRYPEVKEAFANGTVGQSMEILVNDYEIDDRGYTIIKDMEYSSLCLLGVEPCFEGSKVTLFSLENKEKFKQEFSLLLEEIKKFNVEEADKVQDNKELEQEEIMDTIAENETEVEDIKDTEEVVIEEENVVENEEFEQDQDESEEDNQEELVEENLETEEVEEGVIDETDNKEEVQEEKEEFSVFETEEYKELLNKFNEISEKLSSLESEKSQFEARIEELEKVNSELNSFASDIKEKQRIDEINSIEEKFSSKIEENELKSIKDKAIANEISVEDMENQLCKLFTMKSFSLDVEEERIPKQHFSLKEKESKCPYPGLEHLFK